MKKGFVHEFVPGDDPVTYQEIISSCTDDELLNELWKRGFKGNLVKPIPKKEIQDPAITKVIWDADMITKVKKLEEMYGRSIDELLNNNDNTTTINEKSE